MRRRPVSLLATAAFVAAAALTGCGGGGGIASTPPGHQNGEAQRTATQIIADAVAALSHVSSFHLQGGGTGLVATGDLAIPGRMHLTMSQNGGTIEFISIGGVQYFNANRAFWTKQGAAPTAVTILAGRWVKRTQAGGLGSLSVFSALTSAATVGHCLVEEHLGTVSVAGTGSVNGQPAVILDDHGDVPGSAPGQLYVATTGPPLPLRAVQTGPRMPGGTPDARCGETSVSTGGPSDVTISAYNAPVSIAAPAGALDLNALGAHH